MSICLYDSIGIYSQQRGREQLSGFIKGTTPASLLASLNGPPPGHPNRQTAAELPLYVRLQRYGPGPSLLELGKTKPKQSGRRLNKKNGHLGG